MVMQQRYKSSPLILWSPMSVASTSNTAGCPPIIRVEKQPTENVTPRNHNYRTNHFLALYETLTSLSKLPEEDGFHLSSDVCDKALDFMGLIASNLTIDAPRFFPQDGEAAVFTWDTGNIKRLLTLDSEDIDIVDVHKKSFMKCSYAAPDDQDSKYAFILAELGRYAQPSNSSVEQND